jgi:DMSO/TMAO reductase YedYZ heme-binding membrane subunit
MADDAISYGVIALWLISLVLLSSTSNSMDKHRRLWRIIHLGSYAAMPLLLIHAISTGTDLKEGSLRVLWIILIILTFLAIIARAGRLLVRKKPSHSDEPPAGS